MKSEELAPTNVIHGVNSSSVSPKAVVNGAEGDATTMSVESRHHHVRGFQRMNVVQGELMRPMRQLMNGETCAEGKRGR